jgi:selenocysteine lyase/cysteine desulfurase
MPIYSAVGDALVSPEELLEKRRTEGEIDVMRRERILPDDKTLEKIARYEAHLSRQLYHALHELENLQKHRTTGEGTPLARLDVQGSFTAEG